MRAFITDYNCTISYLKFQEPNQGPQVRAATCLAGDLCIVVVVVIALFILLLFCVRVCVLFFGVWGCFVFVCLFFWGGSSGFCFVLFLNLCLVLICVCVCVLVFVVVVVYSILKLSDKVG